MSDHDTPRPFGPRWSRPQPQPPAGMTPVSSMTTLTLIDPDGTHHVLGKVFAHRSQLLTRLIDTPLRWYRDRQIRYHNARMERLAAAKRAIL